MTCTKRPKDLCCEIVNDVLDDLSFAGAPSLQFESEIDNNNDAFFDDSGDIQMLMHNTNDGPDDTDCVCPIKADTITALQFMFLTDHKWTISLLKIVDDIECARLCIRIHIWAYNAHADGYSFYPNGGQSRINNIDVLFKSVANT